MIKIILKFITILPFILIFGCSNSLTTKLYNNSDLVKCINSDKVAIVNQIVKSCESSNTTYIKPDKYKLGSISKIIAFCNNELDLDAVVTPDGKVYCSNTK